MNTIASYFNEDPRDFKTLNYYNVILKECGFSHIETHKITDNVFQHRHEEFLKIYNDINNKNYMKRVTSRLFWKIKEKCNISYLNDFLRDNTEYNQTELYDYYIIKWKKENNIGGQ